MLRIRLNEVSYFLDEVKQSGSLATLVSHIIGLKKLFKEKDRVAREKELESKVLSLTI